MMFGRVKGISTKEDFWFQIIHYKIHLIMPKIKIVTYITNEWLKNLTWSMPTSNFKPQFETNSNQELDSVKKKKEYINSIPL